MYSFRIRRVIFTTDADVTLRMMKARTGLTPNILCRMALAISLQEPGKPRLVDSEEKSQREINRYTLLGEYEAAFISLAKIKFDQDGIAPERADDYFIAHLHRGVSLLANRVKSIGDVGALASA